MVQSSHLWYNRSTYGTVVPSMINQGSANFCFMQMQPQPRGNELSDWITVNGVNAAEVANTAKGANPTNAVNIASAANAAKSATVATVAAVEALFAGISDISGNLYTSEIEGNHHLEMEIFSVGKISDFMFL